MTKEDAAAPCCSFCGKAQLEVWKLVGGPAAHICNECVKLCSDIFSEEGPEVVSVGSQRAHICDTCIGLCNDIITEVTELNPRAVHPTLPRGIREGETILRGPGGDGDPRFQMEPAPPDRRRADG